MKRWHALFFALAIMVAVESFVGNEDEAGVLANVKDQPRSIVHREDGSTKPAAAAPKRVARRASSNPWALAEGEAGEPVEWGEVALAASAGPGATEPESMTEGRGPQMSVAGDRVMPEQRSLIEGA